MAFIDTQKKILAQETARASRITLFGLHYSVDWLALFNKKLIIKALLINETFDIFSDEEIQCLQDKLTSPTNGCITCN